MVSHAAVPFAIPLGDDLFSIYFTTRDGRNRSHGASLVVDLREPTRVLDLCRAPVVAPGPEGQFDDSGAMPSWLVEHQGRDHLYYQGWNLGVTVPFRNAIGLAQRASGTGDFLPSAGPLLDRSVHDPCFVANPCVLFEDDLWRMWYVSCVGWERLGAALRHRYHVKYAWSADGFRWERDGRVCIDLASPEEYAVSRPCVRHLDGSGYAMWYSFRGRAYSIGYAESADGLCWERLDGEAGIGPSSSGWDSEMIEYPFVFSHRGTQYMLYNGNGYGRTGFGLAVQD
jgi:hypothetical protein